MRIIGLCGSHRTGKTTLAQHISAQIGLPFIKTDISHLFAQYHLDPAQPMNFGQRLWIQQQVLNAAKETWQKKTCLITDRTPLDFIAYTLCDIHGDTTVDFNILNDYIADCFETANTFFTLIVLVQPGIPLVYEPGKAALNQAYIEHLNTTLLGLCHDERLSCPTAIMKRCHLSLEERMNVILTLLQPGA